MGDTLHDVVDFHKKEQKDLVPHRGHVLGQDYSGYDSNKMPALNMPSVNRER